MKHKQQIQLLSHTHIHCSQINLAIIIVVYIHCLNYMFIILIHVNSASIIICLEVIYITSPLFSFTSCTQYTT